MRRKTSFITKYQYGKSVVNLEEYVLSLATNCSFKCEYCYLRFSKITSKPIVYNNLDKFEQELEVLFSNTEQKFFYFNFGETTDSLLTRQHFDAITKSANIISEQIKKYNKICFVELRTKTNNIYAFSDTNKLNYDNLKLVYAVTLSPQEVIDNFEPSTAAVNERVQTLLFAEKLGFLTGIRVEPIIIYPVIGISYEEMLLSIRNTIEDYKKLLKDVIEKINFETLHSITLSCLRLTNKQFKILRRQKSKLCFPEMFLCPDGKYRYSRPIRLTIYRELINFIKKLKPQLTHKIMLSFEFDYIWKNCELEIKTLPQISKLYI